MKITTKARTIRWGHAAAAAAVVAVALLPPLNALANGVLFSAHMAQHILLLLIAPALGWLSVRPPEGRAGGLALGGQRPASARECVPTSGHGLGGTVFGWMGGVGSMWVWHLPALCNAAALNPGVRGVQTLSLLALGAAFWRPILSPRARDRLPPGLAVVYLFGACLACTALGVFLTLTPVEVCSAFRAPLTADNRWAAWRARLGGEPDRQIGGLLMWVPMCLVYLTAIVWELGRWFGGRDALPENQT